MNRAFLGLLLSLISIGCFANITYPQAELNAMYSKGKLPKTGPAKTKEETVIDFSECRTQANATYTTVAGHSPAKIMVDSGVLYILKIWRSDALEVVSCSRSDGKRYVTRAEYQ